MPGPYHSPYDDETTLSASEFGQLPHDQQVAFMVHWFGGYYCDPAHETPYNGREGGYLYTRGGPYDANDEISSEFGAFTSEEAIEAAVEEVQSDGIFDWAPATEHPDHIAYTEDALADQYEEEPRPSLDTILTRLTADERPSFGDLAETRQRRLLQADLAELQELLAAQTPRHGGIGHNHPPDEMALTDELTAELTAALETEANELKEDVPELMPIANAAGAFQRVLSWAAERCNLTLDAFLKTAAAAGAGKLMLSDWEPFWLKLGKVYEVTLEWLNLVTLPF